MNSSTKRKVGAIALIVAGIGAFLVPFLLHSPGLQASNSGGGGGGTTTPGGGTPACTSNCSPCTSNCTPSSTCTTNCSTDQNPGSCTGDPSNNTSDKDQGKQLAKGQDGDQGNEGKHLAKGHDNQNSQAASLMAKAQSFMHAMGKHNPQHDATHSTKTDNGTVKSQAVHSDSDDGSDTGACADKGNDDSEDQSNDD